MGQHDTPIVVRVVVPSLCGDQVELPGDHGNRGHAVQLDHSVRRCKEQEQEGALAVRSLLLQAPNFGLEFCHYHHFTQFPQKRNEGFHDKVVAVLRFSKPFMDVQMVGFRVNGDERLRFGLIHEKNGKQLTA